MRLAAYGFAVALILLAGVLAWAVFRGEDTRADLRVVERTVDPCAKPRSEVCQRRIRLVLRELARTHPGELRRLGLRPRDAGPAVGTAPGGGGFGTSPSGGGPVGRVPSPDSPDTKPPSHPDTEPSPEPEPLIDLGTPVPLDVCVGNLVGLNCK